MKSPSLLLLLVLFTQTLLLTFPSVVNAASKSAIQVDEQGISSVDLVERYPILVEIMEETGNDGIPIPHIMDHYPELWASFKKDPEIWQFFQTHLPEFTRERAKVDAKDLVAPFSSPAPELELFSYISSVILHRNFDRRTRTEAGLGSVYVDTYMKWQLYKWRWKNYMRAMTMGQTESIHRAWESHSLDRDYAVWLPKYAQANSNVLDIGTEFGLQSVAIAKEGYNVTGTDVGAAELQTARVYAEKEGVDAMFIQDDVLDGKRSKLTNGTFDVVIDRAVFHSMVPYLEAIPELKIPISLRFAERIKSLVKPGGIFKQGGIFVFKGMSSAEEKFRPQHTRDEMGELNPVATFRLIHHLMKTHNKGLKGSYRLTYGQIMAKIEQEYMDSHNGETNIKAPRDAILQLRNLAYSLRSELGFDTIFLDTNKHPMPHHFTPEQITEYFKDIMGFEIIEKGRTRLWSDTKQEDAMPLAEYALLRVN